jgi:zinc protease
MRKRAFWIAGLAALALGGAAPAVRLSAEGLKKLDLENGLRAVTLRDTTSTRTVLQILIKGGQTAEPEGKAGLAYLTTRLSVDIPDQDKVQDFMTKAVHYFVAAKADGTVIQLECLTEFFDKAAAAFVDILSDPLFTGLRIDRLKESMNDQRRLVADDSDNAAHQSHLESFFGNSAYGRSAFGTEATLEAIKASDIKDFYGRGFVPGNMVLIVLSDMEEDKLAAVLKKRFGGFRKGAAAPFPMAAVPAAANVFSGIRDTAKDSLQTLISAAFALPPLSRRNFALNALVENTLGRGPGTRLWALRSERNLAYAVAARATQMKSGGILESTLETDPAKTESARIALDQVLREFADRGLSADEWEAARAEVKAQFLRGNELKSARAATLGTFEMLGLGADFFEAFAAELDAVRLDELNAYIKETFRPDRASWIRIGPKRRS